MRQIGLVVSNLTLYALFVGATVSLMLGLLVAAGHAVIWRGLDFPIGLRQAAQFGGWAAMGYGLGWLLYSRLRGLFPVSAGNTKT
jgi:hypothetical protein